MNTHTKANYLWILFAVVIGLALTSALVTSAAAAVQDSYPESPFTFLALDDDQVAARYHVPVGTESVPIVLRVHSAMSETVTAQIIIARVVDENGVDIAQDLEITGSLYNIFGLTTNEITFDLLLGSLPEGSYTVTLALGQLGLQDVPAEVQVQLEVGPVATLAAGAEELIAEFNRSEPVQELLLNVAAKTADAQGVQASLKDIKRDVDGKAETVLVDFVSKGKPVNIAANTEQAIAVGINPGDLPGPGVYTGKVSITAENAQEISKALTMIVRESSLIALPEKLEIVRCQPNVVWWPWLSNFLGCGYGSEGVTLANNGEGSVGGVKVLQSQARTASGVPMALYFRQAAGEAPSINLTSLDLGQIDRQSSAEFVVVPGDAPVTGSYSGTISIASPDLVENQEIDISVAVHHMICVPFFVIWFGVLVGYIILRLRDPKKNPKAAQLRLAKIRKWLTDEGAAMPEKLKDSVNQLLLGVEANLEDRAVDLANQKLDKAEQEIAAYHTAQKRMDDLGQKIVQEPGFTALEKAKQQMEAGDLNGALTQANQAKQMHEAGANLIEHIELLTKQIRSEVLDPDLVLVLTGRLQDIEEEIRSESFALGAAERVAWIKIHQVEEEYLEALQQQSWAAVMADEVEAKSLEALDLTVDRLLVICQTPEEQRLVGAPIQFELWGSAGGNRTAMEDQAYWTVLDEQGVEAAAAMMEMDKNMATMRFDRSGLYRIQAAVNGLSATVDINIARDFQIETMPQDLLTYMPLQFSVVSSSPQQSNVAADSFTYSWSISRRGWFGRRMTIDSEELSTPDFVTTLNKAGDYEVTVEIKGGKEGGHWKLARRYRVGKSIVDQEGEVAKRRQLWATLLAMIIATLGGMVAVNVFDVTYGTLQNYIVAFIWGAGVEVTSGSMATWSPLADRLTKLLSGTA